MNRSKVGVTAHQWQAVGTHKGYSQEFELLASEVTNPDWSMEKPYVTGNFSSHSMARSGRLATVAHSLCDHRLWGQTIRLASSAGTFYAPGSWKTVRSYYRSHFSQLCTEFGGLQDAIADVLHEMNTITRPHVQIDLAGLTAGKNVHTNRDFMLTFSQVHGGPRRSLVAPVQSSQKVSQ
jgi:hypothetical protein